MCRSEVSGLFRNCIVPVDMSGLRPNRHLTKASSWAQRPTLHADSWHGCEQIMAEHQRYSRIRQSSQPDPHHQQNWLQATAASTALETVLAEGGVLRDLELNSSETLINTLKQNIRHAGRYSMQTAVSLMKIADYRICCLTETELSQVLTTCRWLSQQVDILPEQTPFLQYLKEAFDRIACRYVFSQEREKPIVSIYSRTESTHSLWMWNSVFIIFILFVYLHR